MIQLFASNRFYWHLSAYKRAINLPAVSRIKTVSIMYSQVFGNTISCSDFTWRKNRWRGWKQSSSDWRTCLRSKPALGMVAAWPQWRTPLCAPCGKRQTDGSRTQRWIRPGWSQRRSGRWRGMARCFPYRWDAPCHRSINEVNNEGWKYRISFEDIMEEYACYLYLFDEMVTFESFINIFIGFSVKYFIERDEEK